MYLGCITQSSSLRGERENEKEKKKKRNCTEAQPMLQPN